MKTPEILLTEDQRKELTQIPAHISDWEISRYYTLSAFDLEIIHQNRRDYNRMGFALQLCCLRYPGWTFTDIGAVPDTVLSYIARQLRITNIDGLYQYGDREATRVNHLKRIRDLYGFRFFNDLDDTSLQDYLMPFAMENDHILRLVKLSIERLREQKIILPGITRIERMVSMVSQAAEDKIYQIINDCLTAKQKRQLDALINSLDEAQITKLAYLKKKIREKARQRRF